MTPVNPEISLSQDQIPEIAPIADPSRDIPQDIQNDAPVLEEIITPIPEEHPVAPEASFFQEHTAEVNPVQDLHLDPIQAPQESDQKPSFAVHIDEPEEQIQDMPAEEAEIILQPIEETIPEEQINNIPAEEEEMPLQPVEEVLPTEEPQEEVSEEEVEPIQESSPEVEQDTQSENALVQKFKELYAITQKMYDIKQTTTGFDILGADNDKIHIMYNFFVGDENYPLLLITKTETDKETEAATQHELNFYLNEDNTSLSVDVDDTIIFSQEELDDADTKTRMQITDKINKFQFLLNEELRKIEKEQQEKNAQEQERKKLQDVFRNF